MVLIETNGELQIKRLEINQETQASISQVFAKGYMSLRNDKEVVAFDGKYKPDEDEMERIKAVFVGVQDKTNIRIEFQKFKQGSVHNYKGN